MVDLDKLDLGTVDPEGSIKAVLDFPRQFEEAMREAFDFDLPKVGHFDSILITGMGGSAVGGDILKVLLKEKSEVFVEVNRGYSIPVWVGKNTLLMGVSYSGNTEETLSSCEEALRRGVKAIFVSSGGKLGKMAEERGIPIFKVPSGLQPRAALGYLSAPLLVFMNRLGVANFDEEFKETISVLQGMSEEFSPEVPLSANGAKELASWLYGSVPLIYGDGGISGVAAYRWKTQINENSKQPAYYHFLPELDHNEIVGWTSRSFKDVFKVVALRHVRENRRVSLRFGITRKLILGSVGGWREIEGKGKGEMALLYSLIYFGDLVSLYLAYLNGVDPTPVDVITELKNEMAKHN